MITKAEIVDEVFMRNMTDTSLSKKQISAAMEGILQAIKRNISNGNAIQIRGFATILPVVKKAKKAHDFQNGKTINMPERKGVKFNVSKDFEDYVNGSHGC